MVVRKAKPKLKIPKVQKNTNGNQLAWFGLSIFVLAIIFVILPRFFPKKQTKSSELVSLAAHNFVGTWTRLDSNNFDNVVVTITNQTATGFTFHVDAQNGMNVGSWGNYDDQAKMTLGTVSVASNIAEYLDDPLDPNYQKDNDSTETPCTAKFVLSDDDTVLDLDTDCSKQYAGFGVDFSGTFRKDAIVEHMDIQDSEMFNAKPDLYSKFVDLVGDKLDRFNETIESESYDTYFDPKLGDVDSSSYSVSHAFTEEESIVVVGFKNKIWTAVIDWDEKLDQPVVRYFTTETAWKNSLPDLIKKWKENFNKYPVIYESK